VLQNLKSQLENWNNNSKAYNVETVVQLQNLKSQLENWNLTYSSHHLRVIVTLQNLKSQLENWNLYWFDASFPKYNKVTKLKISVRELKSTVNQSPFLHILNYVTKLKISVRELKYLFVEATYEEIDDELQNLKSQLENWNCGRGCKIPTQTLVCYKT